MAVDLNDLWIGDEVMSISQGISGKFDGIAVDGIAWVKVKGKRIQVPAKDLELAPEQASESIDLIGSSVTATKDPFHPSIDLHIEVLNPSLREAPSAEIIRYQLSKCREFLESALDHRAAEVRIIHGKGTGVLKHEVEQILKDYPGVAYTVVASFGGAIDVFLKQGPS